MLSLLEIISLNIIPLEEIWDINNRIDFSIEQVRENYPVSFSFVARNTSNNIVPISIRFMMLNGDDMI